jgi:DNA polymerase-3 subunit beta
MKFSVNQQDLQQALNYCQGVIEKRSTLPILSNILLDVQNSRLTLTATDLDLIFIHQIQNIEIVEEGKTTTTSSIMYDIVRKFSSGKKINLTLNDKNKLHLESEKSVFNLNCISASEFPITDEDFNQNQFIIKSKQLLKLLNKCKFSVSNDETRHYLSGIYFHQTDFEDKNYLTAVATDSHRMSISKIRLEEKIEFEPIILPKKTIYQLCALLDGYDGDVKISNVKSKIKFELANSVLISKLIDGKFPNYIQVIPKNNQKKLEIDLKLFLDSVDRVASVSLDKKDGVKFSLTQNTLNLSVNNTNSGDGKETINVKFEHDLEISFNSRYLIDVASQLDGDKIELFFNDMGSPALIKDPSDFDSIFVVMPMKA